MLLKTKNGIKFIRNNNNNNNNSILRSICCSLIVSNENDIIQPSILSSRSSAPPSSSTVTSNNNNNNSNSNSNSKYNKNNDNINVRITTSTRTPYIPKNMSSKDNKKSTSNNELSNWVILSGFSKYSTRQDVIISLNEIKFETIDAMIDKYSNLQGFNYYHHCYLYKILTIYYFLLF